MKIGITRTISTYKKQSGRCFYCKRAFTDNGNGSPTWDHIKPVCEGGTDNDDNLVLACYRCNLMKGSINVDLFMDGYVSQKQISKKGKTYWSHEKIRGPFKWYHRWIGW